MSKPTRQFFHALGSTVTVLAMLAAAATLTGHAATAPDTAPVTAPAVLSDHDLALLHQLESGSWRERKSAEAELDGFPVDNEPIVRAMLAATTSTEAATRLNAVLVHMDDMKGVGATLITMKMADAPAKAVYAELFKQAGGKLKTDPAKLLDDPTLPNLSIDVDHQPFWAVIEKLQSTSKLTPVPDGNVVGGCRLVRGGATIAKPHVVSGPFLIAFDDLPPRFGTDGFLAVVLRVYGEPKLQSILAIDVNVTQAVDDKENVLVQGPPFAPVFMTGNEAMTIVRFKPSEVNPGTRLVRFSAVVTPRAVFRTEHLDIGDLTKALPETIQAGKLKVTFDGCTKTNRGYQVQFSSDPDPQFRIVQILQKETSHLRVLDAAGHDLTPVGTGMSGGGAGGNKVDYIYDTQPARLTCDVQADVRNIDAPVAFKDLNIPLAHLP